MVNFNLLKNNRPWSFIPECSVVIEKNIIQMKREPLLVILILSNRGKYKTTRDLCSKNVTTIPFATPFVFIAGPAALLRRVLDDAKSPPNMS